jgi:cytochrome c-type biogenesis protein CcmH
VRKANDVATPAIAWSTAKLSGFIGAPHLPPYLIPHLIGQIGPVQVPNPNPQLPATLKPLRRTGSLQANVPLRCKPRKARKLNNRFKIGTIHKGLRRRLGQGLRKSLMAVFMVAVTGVQASDDRAQELGEAMICMCGCTQLLSACNMINCSAAEPMRMELRKHIDSGEDDSTILAAFTDKYGPRVLSAPPRDDWFNLSAWVMPFAVLFAGGIVVIFFLRRIKPTVSPEGLSAPDATKYDSEIEEELRKHTPED